MSGDVRVIDDVASFVQFIDSFMCKSMSRRHRSLDSFIWRSAAAFAAAVRTALEGPTVLRGRWRAPADLTEAQHAAWTAALSRLVVHTSDRTVSVEV